MRASAAAARAFGDRNDAKRTGALSYLSRGWGRRGRGRGLRRQERREPAGSAQLLEPGLGATRKPARGDPVHVLLAPEERVAARHLRTVRSGADGARGRAYG